MTIDHTIHMCMNVELLDKTKLTYTNILMHRHDYDFNSLVPKFLTGV